MGKHRTDADNHKIVRLRKQGKSVKEIHEITGFNLGSLNNFLSRYKSANDCYYPSLPKNRKYTLEHIKKWHLMRTVDKLTLQEVARREGVNYVIISTKLSEARDEGLI